MHEKLCYISIVINPLYLGNPLTSTSSNSEDPDEMQHFVMIYTICKGKKDLHTKEYNIL